MRSLREFAQFVGKPDEPTSPRALATYLRLQQPQANLSMALLIQGFEDISAPFALQISAFPSRAPVPFTASLGFGPHPGYVLGVTWRIVRNGQTVAVYPLLRAVAHVGDDGLFATHPFTEPGTYTVEATAHGIGSQGYAEVVRAVTVVAEPKQIKPPPPVTKPTISVAYDGPAASASFTVTGRDFVPNHSVHIRVVNNFTLQNGFFDTTSDSSGRINHEINFPCVPGVQLSFSANDERDDRNDLTGTLWSNTVTLTAS